MATKRNKRRKPNNPNTRWGVGPAAGSQMARTFTDRRKEQSKNACRGPVDY